MYINSVWPSRPTAVNEWDVLQVIPGTGAHFTDDFIHLNSNFSEISFCSHPKFKGKITPKFCKWHYNYAVVACSNIMSRNGIAVKWNCQWILIMMEKTLTHICVGNLTIIGSDNDLPPGLCQAVIWTNAGILLIGPLEINFIEILIDIHIFSFKKMQVKLNQALPETMDWICETCSCMGLELSWTHDLVDDSPEHYLGTRASAWKLIQGSDTHKWNLWSPDLQMNCCFS